MVIAKARAGSVLGYVWQVQVPSAPPTPRHRGLRGLMRARSATLSRMSNRDALAAIASRWISLWCAPVDWSVFRSLHADNFDDRASAGRVPTRDGFAQGLAEVV